MSGMMRAWSLRVFMCPLLCAELLAFCFLSGPAAAQGQKVTLQAGTVVDLVFEETVTPEAVRVGQMVTLRVANPVLVDGRTVIAAGTIATGEVVQSATRGMAGKPAAIGVIVRQVPAVDGTMVPLTGSKNIEGANATGTAVIIAVVCCILGLLIQGGPAEIAAGTSLWATVAAQVEVQPAVGPENVG